MQALQPQFVLPHSSLTFEEVRQTGQFALQKSGGIIQVAVVTPWNDENRIANVGQTVQFAWLSLKTTFTEQRKRLKESASNFRPDCLTFIPRSLLLLPGLFTGTRRRDIVRSTSRQKAVRIKTKKDRKPSTKEREKGKNILVASDQV